MTKVRQSVTHVPLEQLRAHPANIRSDVGDLTEMARSVKEHGILQPLTATEDDEHDGRLLLLAGHRRLGAAILAGLDSVPVIIRHGLNDPAEQLIVMLVENTQRKDLNGMDRAEAYGALRNRGLTLTDIARRTGTHFSTVSAYLNLLELAPEQREEVRTGQTASYEAISVVRERRQEARVEAGTPLRGRPRNGLGWFSVEHRLAHVVRELCTHRSSGAAGMVGGFACGPCWEQAIREEVRAAPVAEPSRAKPSQAEPSRAEPSRAEPSRAALRRSRRRPTSRRRPERPHEESRPHRDRPPRTSGRHVHQRDRRPLRHPQGRALLHD